MSLTEHMLPPSEFLENFRLDARSRIRDFHAQDTDPISPQTNDAEDLQFRAYAALQIADLTHFLGETSQRTAVQNERLFKYMEGVLYLPEPYDKLKHAYIDYLFSINDQDAIDKYLETFRTRPRETGKFDPAYNLLKIKIDAKRLAIKVTQQPNMQQTLQEQTALVAFSVFAPAQIEVIREAVRKKDDRTLQTLAKNDDADEEPFYLKELSLAFIQRSLEQGSISDAFVSILKNPEFEQAERKDLHMKAIEFLIQEEQYEQAVDYTKLWVEETYTRTNSAIDPEDEGAVKKGIKDKYKFATFRLRLAQRLAPFKEHPQIDACIKDLIADRPYGSVDDLIINEQITPNDRVQLLFELIDVYKRIGKFEEVKELVQTANGLLDFFMTQEDASLKVSLMYKFSKYSVYSDDIQRIHAAKEAMQATFQDPIIEEKFEGESNYAVQLSIATEELEYALARDRKIDIDKFFRDLGQYDAYYPDKRLEILKIILSEAIEYRNVDVYQQVMNDTGLIPDERLRLLFYAKIKLKNLDRPITFINDPQY